MTANDTAKIASIIRDAGGRIVGRTRLQKVSYLLEVAGVGEGFAFEYRRYGPYSEDIATATRTATLLGLINEKEDPASWGGYYSIYSTNVNGKDKSSEPRQRLATEAAQAESVELELAATAIFLALEGADNPWAETARRKPDKADQGRLERAKALYVRLQSINTPLRLPEIS